jgi:hypothetical protein
MLIQAAGLAVLAALSPTALLIAAIYLGSERPRLTATFYLIGAVTMSLVMGVVLLAVLRSAQLSHPADHTPRYGLRLGLGLVLLAAGVILRRRKPRPRANPKPGLVSRMAAEPSWLSAFLVGILVFAPGATFVAALQVIATARASFEETAVAVIIVAAINVALVWLPILLHVVAPERTSHYLAAFNTWLRSRSRIVVVWVLVVAGAFLVGNGIYGLTT